MDKRYEVFISSTILDLEAARKEVSEALLRANHFPNGMELFPAADLEQFDFIKQMIHQSDYYIIISAGKYGSIHPKTGLSYTEMEYDFAIKIKKPVIRLLHKDPLKLLPGAFIEDTDSGKEKLNAFRNKLKIDRLANFWEEPGDLVKLVLFGLMDVVKRYPAVGWTRADQIASVELVRKNLDLQEEVASLRKKVAEAEQQLAHEIQDLRHFNSNFGGKTSASTSALTKIYGLFDPSGDVVKENVTELFKNVCGFQGDGLNLLDSLFADGMIGNAANYPEKYRLTQKGRRLMAASRLQTLTLPQ